MEKNKKTCFIAGLILIIIAMAYFAVVSLWSLFIFDLIFSIVRESGGMVDVSAALIMIMIIAIIATCICAIVFSAIGLKRTRLPINEFNAKKWVITVSLVLSLVIFFFNVWGLFSSFSVLNLIANVLIVIGALLIIIGYCKLKKELMQMESRSINE